MSIEILYEGTGRDGSLEPAADIVAIHGLNPWNTRDHAIKTWQSESGHLWLRDSLPLEVPTARTLLYEYGSSPGLGTEKDRFIYQANSLLECLRLIRRKSPTRPLILVGHSLGGILIKQALVNAHANPLYKPIIDATFGLVFFGTPHAGPTEDSKVRFGRTCVSILQSLPGNPSNDIMEALKNGSLYSDILKENWRHQLEKYRIVSFYESIGNLVPRESAIFGLPGDRENVVKLDAKHEDMCRFDPSNKTDRKNYFYVEGNLSELVEAATKEKNQANELDFLELWRRIQLNAQNPRFYNIEDAHVDSLKWIWIKDATGPGFVNWLSEGQGLFWISGIPGSGKSTLMKHIFEDPRTSSYLSHQQQNQVVLIRYFFHELGQALEKQFRGFLSTVLFQLIENFQDIAAEAIPIFMRECNDIRPSTGWICSEKGLKEIFHNINKREKTRRTVCLFIDGLDECEGDQRSHVQFLTSWLEIRGPFVLKICLASRPLLEIDIRLATYPGLKIHDWTKNDISAYVTDRLNRSATLIRQHSGGPQTRIEPRLIEDIVRNASGVFLWVAIVVDELIIGLEEGDDEFELQKRLDALPPDIEGLYARILDKVPVHNLHDTVNYLSLLMVAAFQVTRTLHLGLLHYTLATRSPEEALIIPVREDPSNEEYVSLCKQMIRRLQSRCRSLVQVIPAKEEQVEGFDTRTSAEKLFESSVMFIHRTVKEYLSKTEVDSCLRSKVDPHLLQDPHVSIMAACLRLLKTGIPWPSWPLEVIQHEIGQSTSETKRSWWEEKGLGKASSLVQEIINRAISAEDSVSTAQTKHLDELDRVLRRAHPLWAGHWYHVYVIYKDPEREIDMLAIAASSDLLLYVKEKLVTENFKARSKSLRPLLQTVFDYPENDTLYVPMASLLLEHGAQPNEIWNGVSIWEDALDYCLLRYNSTVESPENWRSVFVLMLQHGADANQVVAVNNGFSTALILTVEKLMLYESLEEWDQEDDELIRTFLNCGADPDARDSKGDSARSLATFGRCNRRVLEIISSFQPTLLARKRRHSQLSDERGSDA